MQKKMCLDLHRATSKLRLSGIPQEILEILAVLSYKFNNYIDYVYSPFLLELITTLITKLKTDWSVSYDDFNIIFVKNEYGQNTFYTISLENLSNTEFLKAFILISPYGEDLYNGITVSLKNSSQKFFLPSALLQHIPQCAKTNLKIQRFKGLGEMNAQQLWDTTLNPSVRTLLQVTVNDALHAEKVISTLMGEHVEPRRDFIQTNAINVTNLDI